MRPLQGRRLFIFTHHALRITLFPMSLRRIASLTALLSFLALVFTSALSYLAPRGPGSSQWEALGINKHGWFELHTNLGVLFLIACIVHIILNIKPIMVYMKNQTGQFRLFTLNFNVALALTTWIILSSIFSWPPVSAIQRFKENLRNRDQHHQKEIVIKDADNSKKELPPTPPFLYSGRSLKRLSGTYDIDVDKIIIKLENLGIDARADWSFNRIAEENDMKTESVYDTVLQIM